MEIGKNRTVDMLFRFLSNETKEQIDEFLETETNYREFKDEDEVGQIFINSLLTLLENVTEEEMLTLKTYTGYNFKNINATLRRKWSYEENGELTQEKSAKYQILAREISRLIEQYPNPPIDFSTYRGVNINAFYDYGITSLEELSTLEGKFMYETGFTSTSIIRDSSYFFNGLGNIEIEYLISKDCTDGILLDNTFFSYSPNQNEYLLNSATLSKVEKVRIDSDNQKAYLTVKVIPKKIWNQVRQEEVEESKSHTHF
ncbi:MAG: hypothetical protein E7168_04810 [Firmicutes bacterium]|nr:hypothetical protein [Bacillota bacterium]